MTDLQWKQLEAAVKGEVLDPLPLGFVIDCPWLPNWYGISILDYFSNDELWFKANLKAIEEFPEAIFLPGFWSEYGMCTEPSAFGARCSFPANEFPHAHAVLGSPEQVRDLPEPNPVKDGLLPMAMNRLKLNEARIRDAGHSIRFSVSRGPLNIASYLMGTTGLMMAMMTHPREVHELIGKITRFLEACHDHQAETFPSIRGIFMLDDIIGFMSADQFEEFGLPYFKRLYDRDLDIRFLHNDAPCMESAPYLADMGVNLFNMGFDTDLNELKKITGNRVCMLGNIPPRDTLAAGNEEEITRSVRQLKESLDESSRIIFSCGGGMPPGVSSFQLRAFIEAVRS